VEFAASTGQSRIFVEGATHVAIYYLFLNLKSLFKNYAINIIAT